mmetsp:Transcript_32245/g.54139  ORF Transcript_32245/g.54139 Transcript_32245/m.54139 type:complete len:215 (-) Transcript_32245:464-1108(-)
MYLSTSRGICMKRHFPELSCPLDHLPCRTTQISPFASAKPERSRFWNRSVVEDPTSPRNLGAAGASLKRKMAECASISGPLLLPCISPELPTTAQLANRCTLCVFRSVYPITDLAGHSLNGVKHHGSTGTRGVSQVSPVNSTGQRHFSSTQYMRSDLHSSSNKQSPCVSPSSGTGGSLTPAPGVGSSAMIAAASFTTCVSSMSKRAFCNLSIAS